MDKPKSLERRLFKVALIIVGIIFVLLLVPVIGWIVSWMGVLWFYAGSVAVCITLPIAFIVAWRKDAKTKSAIFSAARWSFIVGGAIGFVMLAMIPIFGIRMLLFGELVHAKIWLNVPEVRQWAALPHQPQGTSRGIEVPFNEWPATMRRTYHGGGRLHIDLETNTVTHSDGGGFVGGWGITIAPPGTPKPPASAGISISLEDGVWVQRYIQ